MKTLIKSILVIACVFSAYSAQAKTWTSDDGKKTFEGELLSYDPDTGAVGVKLTNGKNLNFTQDKLSEEDINFLKEKGKVIPPDSVSEKPKETSDGGSGDMSKPAHIYLLIGQSNMAGRAPITDKESGPIKGCFLLNGEDAWEAAENPLNRYSTIRKGLDMQKLNPGYGFAEAMIEKNSKTSIGLVVNAKGGSKIEEWSKGTKFYAEAIRRTKEAQKTGTLKGILWHQGESNEGNPDGYLEKLTTLITDLRKDLDMPDLPFVAGQVNNVPAINDQIAKLPKSLPATGFVSSDGLKAMDRWHFDNASMKLLGTRYAEEILKLQAASKK
jgi:hypothetical protein